MKDSLAVRFTAGLTMLSGLTATLAPLSLRLKEHPRLFHALVPYEVYHLSNTLSVLLGFLTLYLSLNLFRRKKNAWLITLLLSTALTLLQLARYGSEHSHFFHLDIPTYSALPACLSIIALLSARKSFTVKSEPIRGWEFLKKALVSLLAVLIYGIVGFFLLDKRDSTINFNLSQAIFATVKEITLIGNGEAWQGSRFARWFLESLRLFGIASALSIAYNIFRPIRYRLVTQPKEREQVALLLDRFGDSSLDYFKLMPDKSYFFSSRGNGFIAYRTELNVAIALGDATASSDSLELLVQEFLEFCREMDWSVAFLQTSPNRLPIYEKLGLKAIKVGEDAVVDLEKFCNDTIKKKTFKSVIKKFDKEGYQLTEHQPPHDESLLSEMEEISRQWLSLPGRRERGFSLGQFNREDLQKNKIYAVRKATGEATAFVNEIRSYTRLDLGKEATIDMMRYRVDAESGTMDYLFAKLLLNLKAQGFAKFSLGLAALSGVGEAAEDNLYEKALHQVYEHLNRFFSYKGLRSYKAKFDPLWEERFLVYSGKTKELVKAGLAIAKVTEE
ncbi:MAG: phosphatidylglycerol lysyltransferase domain-containing protein [Candidatus Obscuribacterales bacterium]|nr:phosphatidylglycerol lysyltransferase domain-containing protein [Candidatus Obscuribacterales bacterium]